MAVNIKAKYKNIPNQIIGPFVATLQYFDSSGFTFNSGSSNTLLNTTGATSSGSVEVFNIGPQYATLKTDLTHQQLISGFTFNQIKCGDSYITFQSTDVCYNSYVADLVGANGSPVLKLTVTNDDLDSVNVSSTLTVVPLNDSPSPIPSSISVSTTSGSNSSMIILNKGKYDFTFNITSTSPTTYKKVELEFIECETL
jgi:hypothetical protein